MDQLPDGVKTILTVVFWGAIIAVLTRKLWWKGRYIIDERGERQRVIAWNRGQPVYDPKTWQQRIFEEVAVRRERRKWLFGTAPLFLGPLALAYWTYTTEAGALWGALSGGLLMCSALPSMFFFIPALFKELLYQSGYQGMKGAKVLDKQPVAQPGREVVETQMAHGDARLAGEQEAMALLKSAQ